VEPLSEARWETIDDAVFRALEAEEHPGETAPHRAAPVRLRTALLIAAALLAAAILVVMTRPFGESATAIMNPSHIETGATPSRLAVGESTIEVGPASAVVASGDDTAGVLVVLERGRVECEVTPRRSRPPFVVQAGNVRVRVVGTRFSVLRDGSEVRVGVTHGSVEVSRGADVTMLNDGASWSSSTQPVAPATSSVLLDALPPPGTTASESASAPSVSTPPKVAHGPSGLPVVDPQRIYESAARKESSAPDGAMVAYRKLAAGGGAWAPPALFAAGRLAADRGRSAEAKTALEEYVRRYPNGANAEDARRILARLP